MTIEEALQKTYDYLADRGGEPECWEQIKADARLGAAIRRISEIVKDEDSFELCCTRKGWHLEIWSGGAADYTGEKEYETPEEALEAVGKK